jgi:Methyltransferase domain
MGARMMSEELANAWRPRLVGWSSDIIPFYDSIAHELPNPCTVVEIGSAHGRSAIFLAEKLLELGHGSNSQIFMVDDWGGEWFAECLPSIVEHATKRELEMLRPVRATSKVAGRMFHAHSSDLVFIDGDHSRIGCADDLYRWFGVTKPNGIFSGHDYDPIAHPGVVEAVDAFIANAPTGSLRTRGGDSTKPMLATRSVWRLQ